jgi:glycosyltransferase involved in cell wall biosynthesis
MGHEVDIIAGRMREGLPQRETHEGVRIHRFPALRSPARARWWFVRNIGLLRRADVIHVSNTHMLEYLWRMLGIGVDRRKVFLTRHGMSYIHPVPPWEKRRAIRSLALASGVVHDGAFIEKWLGVKPDLCPDQGLSPTADEIEQIPEPSADSATYIGRIEPDSGISVYMDGVRILTRKRGRPFDLRVYGDGSLAAELREKAARENLPIHFHGRTPDAQRFISESCFAFIDGRMAIQEAMARKRLVIAAYVDPLKQDYVGTEPFSPHLVPVADGTELADRVCYYIDHPEERQTLVKKAFDHAQTLTWHRTAEAYLHFWRERLAHPRLRCSKWQALRYIRDLRHEAVKPKEIWAPEATIPGHAATTAAV